MEMSETRGPDRARGIGGVLMRRRQFITILGGAAATWALTARAQRPSDRPLIGFLDGKRQSSGQGLISAFQQGLRELGYDEGRNIDIVYRFADGLDERLPAIAEELVRLKPAVIVAPGVNAAVTAKNVTATIPIVSWTLADAVHLGLVASYAHPGGNVTGITPYVDGLPAKQMELARDVVPGAGSAADQCTATTGRLLLQSAYHYRQQRKGKNGKETRREGGPPKIKNQFAAHPPVGRKGHNESNDYGHATECDSSPDRTGADC
jgi:ABC transporter substrate binding protein